MKKEKRKCFEVAWIAKELRLDYCSSLLDFLALLIILSHISFKEVNGLYGRLASLEILNKDVDAFNSLQ